MPSLVVGTAGHIDHGKSSLVLAMTGTDPDRLKEEKARGITIDLGFAHWTKDDVAVAFVDVPGHERFVRNMLAGVGGIDAVLLVVAADESVMPQTREHFQICRLLGVTHGVVALTKCDLVDDDVLAVARMEVASLLEGSPLGRAPIVAVSSRTGEGLDALGDALVDLARRVPPRGSRGAARLPVDRAFSMKGFGTVVTGTLVSGRITLDQELAVVPSGLRVKVRGVQVHGAARKDVEAGHRAALNLGGVEVADVPRGQVLAEPGTLEVTRIVDAVIELLDEAKPLKHGTRVRVHQGTAEVLGRVGLAPLPGGELLSPGARGFVRIRLEQPVAVTRGDRVILRAYSPPRTIAGGVVLDPQAPRSGLRGAASRARFQALEPDASAPAAPHDRALATFVAESGAAGLRLGLLTSRGGLAPADVASTAERLARAGLVDRIGGSLFAPALRASLAAALEQIVRDHHKAQPLSEGLPREEARERLFGHADLALFERVLADLAARKSVTGRERLVAAGHAMALSADEAAARDRIAQALERGGLKPPEPAAIAADARLGADVVMRVLSLLVRQKAVAKLDTLYFDVRALDRLKGEVRAMREGGQATVDVAAFKDRYGLTRKHAIPLLEYLDRERVTRRQGDLRVIL
jgi:selenocysteine-specific elongation factor